MGFLNILSRKLYTFCDKRLCLILSKYQPVQPFTGSMIRIWYDMAISIHGSLNGSVAQLGLNELDVFTLNDEKGSVGVSLMPNSA